MAQLALLSLALPRSTADRPSTSRRLPSLPSDAPTMRPLAFATMTMSGSGLFQTDFGWMPISAPTPTEAIGGHLVKISASGPMPPSRYGDQPPRRISASFSFAASGEPGFRRAREVPISAGVGSRGAAT